MATNQREQTQAFAQELVQLLGDDLESLIMFGSAVRGGVDPSHADANLLLVLRDASTAALRPIEPAIAKWVKRRRPAPLIFTASEWRSSADVFPMEIEDMRDAHELLAGDDPFTDLRTNLDDLRMELERETRGKLLQLRAEYAAVATDGRSATILLIDSLGTFLVLMRGLVRLTGGTPERDPGGLVRQASEAAGLNVDAFQWVVDKVSGRTVQALKSYDPMGARYVDELERLADFVDRFEQPTPAATP